MTARTNPLLAILLSFLLFCTLFLALPGCHKVPKGTPSCVKSMLNKDKTTQGGQGIVRLEKWTYPDGQEYYLFSMDCCDQFNELYDSDCNYVCAPSGGFSGGGDGKCQDALPSGTPTMEVVWSQE